MGPAPSGMGRVHGLLASVDSEALSSEGEWRARALVQQLVELERRGGVTEFRVWVIESNDSTRRAYERLGFESTGEVKQLDGSGRVEERLRRWIGVAPEARS